MKIEELENQIENEARTDYDWKDVLNIIDSVKDILDDNHNHFYKVVIDKSGYRLECNKCHEVSLEVITNED